jgi:hypothetical protein
MTTLVTAAQIATVRRMVAEPTTTTYSDALITAFIETYPCLDEQGEEPFTLSSAVPPVHVVNTEWMPTYDLNGAAADIWQEKAGAVAHRVDFSADGGNYSVSNMYEQYMKLCRHYRARMRPSSARAHKWPEEKDAQSLDWVINLPEPSDAD